MYRKNNLAALQAQAEANFANFGGTQEDYLIALLAWVWINGKKS